jgi:hypothetical protein
LMDRRSVEGARKGQSVYCEKDLGHL